MDDDQPLLALFPGHDLVARGLLLGHLLGMAGEISLRVRVSQQGRSWSVLSLTRGLAVLASGGLRWFLSL
jgi:hypothetical protein